MNKITVIGRMSTDVEVKDFNGRNVANFNVASQNKNRIRIYTIKNTLSMRNR